VRADRPVRRVGGGSISLVRVDTEILAEIRPGERIGRVVANDSGRWSFPAVCGGGQDRLVALDPDFRELAGWRAGHGLGVLGGYGWPASCPGRGLALACGPDSVVLLDRAGMVAWRHGHAPWPRGCPGRAWFGMAGEPYAVVPGACDGCAVRRLGLESGEPLAAAPLMAEPAGIRPVHQGGGWAGLSGGEGQAAARAWWVRPAEGAAEGTGLRVIDAGWDDWVLGDADPPGSRVRTVSHDGRRLLVRSFPAACAAARQKRRGLSGTRPSSLSCRGLTRPTTAAGTRRPASPGTSSSPGWTARPGISPPSTQTASSAGWTTRKTAGRPADRTAPVRGYQRRLPPLPAARKLTPRKPPDRRFSAHEDPPVPADSAAAAHPVRCILLKGSRWVGLRPF